MPIESTSAIQPFNPETHDEDLAIPCFDTRSRSPRPAWPAPALATNGYFPHGYGMKAKRHGRRIAGDGRGQPGRRDQPGRAWCGPARRLDVGLDVFMPRRDAERTDAGFAPINGKVDSDKNDFFIPEFGYNHMVSSDLSLGVSASTATAA